MSQSLLNTLRVLFFSAGAILDFSSDIPGFHFTVGDLSYEMGWDYGFDGELVYTMEVYCEGQCVRREVWMGMDADTLWEHVIWARREARWM